MRLSYVFLLGSDTSNVRYSPGKPCFFAARWSTPCQIHSRRSNKRSPIRIHTRGRRSDEAGSERNRVKANRRKTMVVRVEQHRLPHIRSRLGLAEHPSAPADAARYICQSVHTNVCSHFDVQVQIDDRDSMRTSQRYGLVGCAMRKSPRGPPV